MHLAVERRLTEGTMRISMIDSIDTLTQVRCRKLFVYDVDVVWERRNINGRAAEVTPRGPLRSSMECCFHEWGTERSSQNPHINFLLRRHYE